MKSIYLTVALLVPFIANGQARRATCEVRPLWSIKGGVRSANLEAIGAFQPDEKEGMTVRSFKLPDTNLVVTAGIAYEFDYSHKPKPSPSRIALAITVSDSERKDIFESVDSSEASTRYSKNWNVSVTKNILFDQRIYLFTLSCWDGPKPSPIGRRVL